MPTSVPELSAVSVRRLVKPGLHAVGGVKGLYLQVTHAGARSWILRVTIGGRRRDLGLGSLVDVPLAAARVKARVMREQIAADMDPQIERKAARSALRAQRLAAVTFAKAAEALIASKAAEWKSPKHRGQWEQTLALYAFPKIGGMHVQDVALPHVLAVLEPIWPTITETAARLRGRIEAVLDYATVHGWRKGDNPARWKGHLDKVLAAPNKIAPVRHHAAMPYSAVPDFMASLCEQGGQGARALELVILTAARSGEVRGMRWSEIDLAARVWAVPPARMKASKEHRVPLSPAAVSLLKAAPQIEGCDLVFPGARGRPLSDMSLSAVLKRMKIEGVTVHGFRSSFRDWAAERTSYPREVIEQALAHSVDNKVEAAYFRSDLFEKRRRLMDGWAKFCSTPQASKADNVVSIAA